MRRSSDPVTLLYRINNNMEKFNKWTSKANKQYLTKNVSDCRRQGTRPQSFGSRASVKGISRGVKPTFFYT